MKKNILLCFIATATLGATAQQKIKDGTGTPATSLPAAGSILELQSTQAGLRMPQVSLTDTKTWAPLIGSGAATTSPGMTVYNTNAAITNTTADANYPALGKGEYYWDGTGWVVKNPVATAAYIEPWYNVATNTGATANTQNIYQMANVGIGTATPAYKLHVNTASLKVINSAVAHTGQLYDGTSNVEGGEMTASGTDAWMSVQRNASTGYSLHVTKNNPAGGGLIYFALGGASPGYITTTSTSVSYISASDIRLKENIKTTHFGIADLMKIKVADYSFISDKTHRIQTGFLAQDLYKIYPDAVAVGNEATKTPWGVDYGKVTPLIVKAVQEQEVKIDDQQIQIQELKKQIAELKALTKK